MNLIITVVDNRVTSVVKSNDPEKDFYLACKSISPFMNEGCFYKDEEIELMLENKFFKEENASVSLITLD